MKLNTSDVVTIHPYFKAKPGMLPQIKALLPAFAAQTANEKDNLFYDFTINGDEISCREGYRGAEAALAHLDNVATQLTEMSKLADLDRLEIHGPAAELEKMRSPLESLAPAWFVRECGV